MAQHEAMQKAVTVGLSELKRQTLPLLAQPFLRASAPAGRLQREWDHSRLAREPRFALPSFDLPMRELDSQASGQKLQPCVAAPLDAALPVHEFASLQLMGGGLVAPHLSTFSSILASSRLDLGYPQETAGGSSSSKRSLDSMSESSISTSIETDVASSQAGTDNAERSSDTGLQRLTKCQERQAADALTRELSSLRRRLQQQRRSDVQLALRHHSTMALRAWASHALLARQRRKHQEKLATAVAKSSAQLQKADRHASRRDVQLVRAIAAGRRRRVQRAFFDSWASASGRPAAAQSRGRPELGSVATEAVPRAPARSRPVPEAAQPRVYSPQQLLRQRGLVSPAPAPPPGLEQPLFRLLAPPPGLACNA